MSNTISPLATPVAVPVAGGTVSAHVTGGIGRIAFHHPKGNSLPGALLRELAATITRVAADPDARVLLLSSGGAGAFCAGASFDELVRVRTPEEGREFFSGFAGVILAMLRAPQFVVTRVQGRAAGGAVGLIAASDLSFAVAGASAKLSELAIGIGPFVVGPVIERKIGLAAFSAMAANADWRDAAWAERHGLYSFVFDTEQAMDAAIEAELQKLATYSPEAMAQLKRVFWAGTESWDALLAERAMMSGTLVLSEFTRAAIARFNAR
ncbi:MAG: enoyl-CoA hydratase/isomerase family protein [Gemmatimonadaceae bacterium]|jgi:methylglutaconyl-CoA hydratase|nr:enoyl-CoA hydratase/isomerase family protein [Gemmatimonadaceae bacterium]